MKPTYDALFNLVAEQRKVIEEQRRTIALLEKKVADLEERLNIDSQNSSKPPSTDQKKNKQSPKGGAKKGHPGHYRKLYPMDKITRRVYSSLNECEHCGCKNLEHKSSQIFQQVELPDIKPIVTQIELGKAICCGCVSVKRTHLFGKRLL